MTRSLALVRMVIRKGRLRWFGHAEYNVWPKISTIAAKYGTS